MHHENVDPLKTEPGFGLSVTRRQRHGVAWCERGAGPATLRRCIAHQIRHGTPKWRARRDRRTRDGGKCFSAGLYCDLPRKKSREPSVGDAERVSAREPPFGQFLACSALYKHVPIWDILAWSKCDHLVRGLNCVVSEAMTELNSELH